ncbi:Zinc finger protein PLAGL1 [Folsomia candida]|uniref:Zinc finger protein PLAGL1 n=1 Tax=Folsomia candida TaxID=158441 RepID=A0A226DCW5_FOLCA|nr:Zinc finger protein PLAGL1 [Folsomia candida]
MHSAGKLPTHVCEICGKTVSNIELHVWNHHKSPEEKEQVIQSGVGFGLISCDKCGKEFSGHDKLAAHQTQGNRYPAAGTSGVVLGSADKSDTSLSKPSNGRLTCRICGRSVTFYSHAQHEWTHKNEAEKEESIRLGTSPKVRCHICNTYVLHSGYKAHLDVHKNPEEISHLVCEWDGCGRKFARKSYLALHIKTFHQRWKSPPNLVPEKQEQARLLYDFLRRSRPDEDLRLVKDALKVSANAKALDELESTENTAEMEILRNCKTEKASDKGKTVPTLIPNKMSDLAVKCSASSITQDVPHVVIAFNWNEVSAYMLEEKNKIRKIYGPQPNTIRFPAGPGSVKIGCTVQQATYNIETIVSNYMSPLWFMFDDVPEPGPIVKHEVITEHLNNERYGVYVTTDDYWAADNLNDFIDFVYKKNIQQNSEKIFVSCPESMRSRIESTLKPRLNNKPEIHYFGLKDVVESGLLYDSSSDSVQTRIKNMFDIRPVEEHALKETQILEAQQTLCMIFRDKDSIHYRGESGEECVPKC